MQRNPSATRTVPIVHHSPGRRPTETPVIDMDDIWAQQQVENAKWMTVYAALIQGAMAGAMARPAPKEGEEDEINLDYEALAMEADHAYSRFAARVRGQRGKGN